MVSVGDTTIGESPDIFNSYFAKPLPTSFDLCHKNVGRQMTTASLSIGEIKVKSVGGSQSTQKVHV